MANRGEQMLRSEPIEDPARPGHKGIRFFFAKGIDPEDAAAMMHEMHDELVKKTGASRLSGV